MTIPFKTTKAEGLLVKVPDNTFGDFSYDSHRNHISATQKDFADGVDWFSEKLPEGNWKLIGSPFEISEEQARELVEASDKTAVEAWEAFVESLEVYQTNPYEHLKEGMTFYEGSENEYQHAQSRTGVWVLLIKEKG